MNNYWNLFRERHSLSKDNCEHQSEDPFFGLNRYDASLEQGFDLKRGGLPKFLVSAFGLSVIEEWGRWSDFNLSPEVTLVFAQDLPREFTLELTVMGFGPNVGEDMLVSAGESEYRVSVPSELEKVTVDIVSAVPTRVVSISAPFPTSPLELSLSEDGRKIGLGFSKIRILEFVKKD
jgi:phosphoglycerol transferase